VFQVYIYFAFSKIFLNFLEFCPKFLDNFKKHLKVNVSNDIITMTEYTPNHSANDIPGIVIDFLVEYGVQLLAFAGLIALVTLFVWAKNQV